MQDYLKRFLVVIAIAACIGVLFIGGQSTKAMMIIDQSNILYNYTKNHLPNIR